MEIRVWVPSGAPAELVTAEGAVPMRREGEYVLADLAPGTDYRIAVDGGDPLPDPRSAWQPDGVHGPSRAFDATAFRWTDAGFPGVDALGAPTYELHLGTFTPEGTLDAAIGKLPYLEELGIRMIELMPVNAFPGERGWSYDGVYPYAVQHSYGGPEALQRFVDAAHGHGLGVCLDVVHNHQGPSGNYLAQFGPYFTDRHMTPWGEGPNVDGPDARGVRDFIIDGVLRWARDFHIDAFRLDAVHAIRDDSGRHILAELADRVAELSGELGRPIRLVAESDLNDVRMITPTFLGGLGMDGQWADDVHHAFHARLTGENFGYYGDFAHVGSLARVLRHVFLHAGTFSTFRGKVWGAPVPDEVDRRRFTVFLANHDQIGNRALGDRMASRVDRGTLAGGFALLLLAPFTPMIFQGDEWGTASPFQFFTDHGPDIGPHVAEGRRREFAGHGWAAIYGEEPEVPDPQAEETFLASKLPWEELETEPAQRMHAWVRDLLALRGEVFGDGTGHQLVDVEDTAEHVLMRRGPLTVVTASAHVEAPVSGEPVLSWGDVTLGDGTVRLGPASTVVLRA